MWASEVGRVVRGASDKPCMYRYSKMGLRIVLVALSNSIPIVAKEINMGVMASNPMTTHVLCKAPRHRAPNISYNVPPCLLKSVKIQQKGKQ